MKYLAWKRAYGWLLRQNGARNVASKCQLFSYACGLVTDGFGRTTRLSGIFKAFQAALHLVHSNVILTDWVFSGKSYNSSKPFRHNCSIKSLCWSYYHRVVFCTTVVHPPPSISIESSPGSLTTLPRTDSSQFTTLYTYDELYTKCICMRSSRSADWVSTRYS